MQISKYFEYLTVQNIAGSFNERVVTGDKLGDVINEFTCHLEQINTYEIYTKNATTGEGGWDICLVRSTDTFIKMYPLFDCIITKNDCVHDESFLFLQANDIN